MENVVSYPDANIDPKKKGYDYILQYTKAAYADSNTFSPALSTNVGRSRYAEIREYTLGKQSIMKYQRVIPGNSINDKTSLNQDWRPLSILTKFREIAISKLLQRNFDIQAFAVDPLSKTEEDEYFNQMKIKIMMREIAKKAGSYLADSPLLKPSEGEPEDMEQLKMQMDYGYKHIMCMEAEEGIQLVFNQNDIEEQRKQTVSSLYDFGIGGYKVFIDYNGKVKLKAVDPEQLVTSYVNKPDFSDMVHCGEKVEVLVADLVPYFNSDQIENICKSVAGKYGNPATFEPTYARYWDKFKCLVLDFQFITWNTYVYERQPDDRFGKVDYKNIGKVTPANPEQVGASDPIYMSNSKKVVYKSKWIIGSDYMYDYGLKENQVRKYSSWWDTKLDYHLYTWNGYKMMFSGITERLIPIEDAICLTWEKLQNLKAKLIPYLIDIDLNALESTAFSSGGKKFEPADLIDFAFSNFILVSRKSDLMTGNPNYKAMTIEASGQLVAFAQLYEDLAQGIQRMRDVSGLNELTDGSTPNAKTLVPVAEAAQLSTNNALYLVGQADKRLIVCAADAVMCNIQIAVKLGKVDGYVKPLGIETVKFLQINPDISLKEFGIFIEDMPTDAQREQLIAELNLKDSQGLIDPADKIIVMSCRNLKQARILLAYNIKKRREEEQARQMQLLQQQQMGNAQVAQAAEQAKQQTIIIQHQAEMELLNAKMQWEFIIEQMKKQGDIDSANVQAQAKIIGNQLMANAKIATSFPKTG